MKTQIPPRGTSPIRFFNVSSSRIVFTRFSSHVVILLAVFSFLGALAWGSRHTGNFLFPAREGDAALLGVPRAATDADPVLLEGDAALEQYFNGSGFDGTEGNPFILENLQITPPDGGYGIYIANTNHHVLIRNCRVTDAYNASYSGIFVLNSPNVVVEGNTVERCANGIWIQGSPGSKVLENEVRGSTGHAILVLFSDETLIQDNYIRTKSNIGVGIHTSKNVIARANNVSHFHYGAWIHASENVTLDELFLDENKLFGIYGGYSTNVTIKNSFIDGNHNGKNIIVEYSTNITVEDCVAINSGDDYSWQDGGIVFKNVSGILVKGNFLNSTNHGVLAENGSSIVISNNQVINANQAGIILKQVTGSLIESNMLGWCFDSIHLWRTNESVVRNNTLRDNYNHGMFLQGSWNNTIDQNVIENASTSGLFISGSGANLVKSNVISRSAWDGIAINGNDNTFIENEVTGCGHHGIYLFQGSSGNVFRGTFLASNGRGCVGGTQDGATFEDMHCMDGETTIPGIATIHLVLEMLAGGLMALAFILRRARVQGPST